MKALFSHATILDFEQCVRDAVLRSKIPISDLMELHMGIDAGELSNEEVAVDVFLAYLAEINWYCRDTILPIIPIIERCYFDNFRNFKSVHMHMDRLLNRDGYEMRNRRLVRLRHWVPWEERNREYERHNWRLHDYKKARQIERPCPIPPD